MRCTPLHPSAQRRRCEWAARIGFALVLAAGSAGAHVIMGTKSLHLRVVESEAIVVGRVVDPQALFVSEDARTRRQLVEIEVVETLKGAVGAERLLFAQGGHDVARYGVGQEALFFLHPIAKSRELAALAVPGGPTHVSSQEHDDLFPIGGASGAVLLQATRDLVVSESARSAGERVGLIRKATLDLLTSGDTQLGHAALASLVLAPDANLVSREDLPRLERILDDPKLSVGFRAALIAELERRQLVDGPARWTALLQNATPSQRPTAIRASAAHPSEPVERYWLAQLSDPSSTTAVKVEAAIALGTSRHARAVQALADALASDEPRLRNAAIRGLGRVGSAEAASALERIARTHADPGTRRRALAELRTAEARKRP